MKLLLISLIMMMPTLAAAQTVSDGALRQAYVECRQHHVVPPNDKHGRPIHVPSLALDTVPYAGTYAASCPAIAKEWIARHAAAETQRRKAQIDAVAKQLEAKP